MSGIGIPPSDMPVGAVPVRQDVPPGGHVPSRLWIPLLAVRMEIFFLFQVFLAPLAFFGTVYSSSGTPYAFIPSLVALVYLVLSSVLARTRIVPILVLLLCDIFVYAEMNATRAGV